jgi:hypothetical protein
MVDKKRHRALTHADRLLIQNRNQTHPPVHQKDLTEWFKMETGYKLTQGTISRVLSKTYDFWICGIF